MGIPPERRTVLRILPPDLIEALRQPMADAARHELLRTVIAEELVRQQALRYVEEMRLAQRDADADQPAADAAPSRGDPDP